MTSSRFSALSTAYLQLTASHLRGERSGCLLPGGQSRNSRSPERRSRILPPFATPDGLAARRDAQTKGKHGSNLSLEPKLLCLVFTRLMQAHSN
ncbi:protein of unknown function [Aminobacter niigataensis]|nr:protein of unknown function [Aminobacter niigataensis]